MTKIVILTSGTKRCDGRQWVLQGILIDGDGVVRALVDASTTVHAVLLVDDGDLGDLYASLWADILASTASYALFGFYLCSHFKHLDALNKKRIINLFATNHRFEYAHDNTGRKCDILGRMLTGWPLLTFHRTTRWHFALLVSASFMLPMDVRRSVMKHRAPGRGPALPTPTRTVYRMATDVSDSATTTSTGDRTHHPGT